MIACGSAFLANAAPVRVGHVEAELVSESATVQPGQSATIALRIQTDEEWHVYWKNPGDAGLPPKIKWTLPDGVLVDSMQFPIPSKILSPPLASYGYEGDVLYLMHLTVPSTVHDGDTLHLRGEAKWLVCREECVPGSAMLALDLPVRAAAPQFDSVWSRAISVTRDRLPVVLPGWNVRAYATADSLNLFLLPPEGTSVDSSRITFFPGTEGLIQAAKAQPVRTTGKGLIIGSLRNPITKDLPDSISGIVVNANGWRGPGSEKGLAFTAKIEKSVPQEIVSKTDFSTLIRNILFAMIGGLILNLMPCVLPVLSLKIFGFVAQAGEDRRKVFRHGLAFTAGVLVSFWILSGLLLALRAGGEQIGWGFQLQSPVFVALIACFMFLFGLNLLGVFELGTSLTSVGGAGRHAGLSGSFMNGVTATVVATPCTAPFMGSALGYALTQPAYVSLLIFTGIGLGMALPYLILSAWPGLLRFVPKPGRWMESLKQFMGFLLFATVIYLAYVLAEQSGGSGVVYLMAALLLLGLGGWIYGRWGHFSASRRSKLISGVVTVVLLTASTWLITSQIESMPVGTVSDKSGLPWEPYSAASLASYRSQGKPVFLDFTAAWCLSCKVNEKTSLSSPAIIKAFRERGITPMRGDWTNRDAEITVALAKFGRNSVPLYVFYDGRSAEPTVLPEILTESLVLQNIGAEK